MIRHIATLTSLLLTTTAHAQDIRILSGEHGDFTRLVFMYPAPVDWALEPTDGGFRLDVPGQAYSYDMDLIYRRIGRDRFREVSTGAGPSSVELMLNDDVALRSYQLPSGAVVVDALRSETPVDYDEAYVPSSPTLEPAPVEATAPVLPDPMVPGSAAPIIELDETAVDSPSTDGSATGPSLAAPTAQLPPISLPLMSPDIYWTLSGTPPATNAAQASEATEAPIDAPPSTTPEQAEPNLAEAPEPAIPLALNELLKAPDGRVQQAEEELLQQLGRAAAQGLIRLDTPLDDRAAHTATEPPPIPEPEALPADHIAVHAETAVDRDTSTIGERINDLTGRTRCLPDRYFALREWEDGGDAFALVSDARRQLVGEFDKPNPDAAINLAQTYLAFGFGAEARAVTQAFAIEGEQRQALDLISEIVDGEPVNQSNPILGMTACDGAAALWSVLGRETPVNRSDVHLAAIQRSFSDLPVVLRTTLGVPLSRKLMDLGATDAAKNIQHSLHRGELEPSSSSRLVDAQVDGSDMTSTELHSALEPVLSENSENGIEAAILVTESAFREGRPVDQLVVDNAGAMATELLPTPDGARLLRAQALGQALNGQIDAALDTIGRWPADVLRADRERTYADVTRTVPGIPDDDAFLMFFYRNRDRLSTGEVPDDTRLAIAERLVALGFGDGAERLMSVSRDTGNAERMVLARAALAQMDGPSALAHLSGQQGSEADALRGQAYRLLGEHGSAEQAFAEAGDIPAATNDAFRSGNWTAAVENADPARRSFIEAFDLAPGAEAAPPAAGPLASARNLLQQTQQEVDAYQQLINSLNP